VDLPSRLDYFAIAAGHIAARAQKIDPLQPYVEGSDANVFAGSSAVLAAAVTRQIAYKANALLLDGAERELLDRWVFDRYRMTRKGAAPALGRVRFYRPALTFGAGTIDANTKLVSNTGAEYITTTAATFGLNDLESFADVRAVQAGKATQVGANQIRKFATASDAFDRTIKINNDLPTAGGENVEDDPTLRGRARQFWAAARRGTLGAIEFGAISVPGVTSAQAIEALTTGNTPARVVSLYIADSSGVASDQLAHRVAMVLDDYRAGGIAVLIYTSLPQIVTVSLVLGYRANVDTVALTEIVRAAIIEYVNSLDVNQPLLVGDIYAVLRRFRDNGLVATENSIIAPVGDLYPEPGQTLRTTATYVTVA
jgi:uncharacterized phage protein gp47/JayE